MMSRTLASVLCTILIAGASIAAAEVPRQGANLPPSAQLVLAADIEGRFFVRTAARELIAEVYKPAGRTLSLKVDPGVYEVRVEREQTTLVAKVNVAEGAEVVLDRNQLGPITIEAVAPPGGGEVVPYAVTGRNRFDVRFGAWSHGNDAFVVVDGIDTSGVLGGIRYTHYFKESLAATFSIEGGGGYVGEFASIRGSFEGVSGIVSFPVGVRWNPLQFGRQTDGIKPFVAFSAGPVIGDTVIDGFSGRRSVSSIHTSATIGGFAGGGVDFHAGRTCVIGVEGGYNWMADFSDLVGGSDNYSGPAISVSLGFMWGRGSTPRP
jgi:hypothetical protein